MKKGTTNMSKEYTMSHLVTKNDGSEVYRPVCGAKPVKPDFVVGFIDVIHFKGHPNKCDRCEELLPLYEIRETKLYG